MAQDPRESQHESERLASPTIGRTLKAAAAVRSAENGRIIQPRELVEVAFAPGCAPSAAARRALVLVIDAAGPAAGLDIIHRISKKELRRGHKGNERLGDLLNEIAGIRLHLRCRSTTGAPAVERAGLFSRLREEDGDTGFIEFRFSDGAREIFAGSQEFARLRRDELLKLRSAYAITMFLWGSLFVGREHRTWGGSVDSLRSILGVPQGALVDWHDLERRALRAALDEINAVAHFGAAFKITGRRGRKVTRVEINFFYRTIAPLRGVVSRRRAAEFETAESKSIVDERRLADWWLADMPWAQQLELHRLFQKSAIGYQVLADWRWRVRAWRAAGRPGAPNLSEADEKVSDDK